MLGPNENWDFIKKIHLKNSKLFKSDEAQLEINEFTLEQILFTKNILIDNQIHNCKSSYPNIILTTPDSNKPFPTLLEML